MDEKPQREGPLPGCTRRGRASTHSTASPIEGRRVIPFLKPAPLLLAIAALLALFLVPTAHAQEAELPEISITSAQPDFRSFVREGEPVVFTFSRSGDTSQPLTVRVHTYEPLHPQASPGSTEPPDNPSGQYHNVTFEAESATAALTVIPDPDGVEESSDVLWVMVSPEEDSPYRVAANHGLGRGITVMDPLPATELPAIKFQSVQPVDKVREGANVTYTLHRTGDTSQPLTVRVFTFEAFHPDAVGVLEGNPTAVTHDVTFAAGSVTATLVVTTDFDGVPETSDRIDAILAPQDDSQWQPVSPFQHTIQIEDVARTVTIGTSQTGVAEGETATFTLTRTGGSNAEELAVNIDVDDPGAFLRGNHWRPDPVLPVEAVFEAGSDTAAISLETKDDRRDIPNNALVVTVKPGIGYSTVTGSASAGVTVTDNDTAPTLALSVNGTSLVEEPAPGVEEGTTVVVTLTRGGDFSNPIEFAVTHGFEGEPVTGYTGFSGSETVMDWRVETEDDDLDELDAVYRFEIAPIPGVPADAVSEYWKVQGGSSVSVTVRDNDLPLIYIEPREPSARELSYGWFRVTRVGRTDYDLNINTHTTEVGRHIATFWRDWLNRDRTYTIDADSGIKDIGWVIGGDDGDEDDGALTMRLVESPLYRIDPDRSTATLRIIDIEPRPTMSIEDATASEGAGAVEFTVTLTAEFNSRRTITVDYATSEGTAVPGDADGAGDYTETRGTLTFRPGQTSKTISAPVTDDDLAEYDELFSLALSNPVNAALADGQTSVAVAGIIEDDEPEVTVAARSAEVTEGEPAVFDLTRTGDTTGELTVHLVAVVSGGGSLRVSRQEVTFPVGATTATWEQATVDDDEDEKDGRVAVRIPMPGSLDVPETYHSRTPGAVVVTVLDDEVPTVTIAADHNQRTEGEDATFTLSRDGYLSVPLTVDVSVTGGDGFITGARPGTVTFAKRESTATLTVATTDDDPEDEHDRLTAAVTASDDYHVGDPGSATVSLFDSERTYPEVSIHADDGVVDEGEDVVFTLTRSGYGLDESLTVRVQVQETLWNEDGVLGDGPDPVTGSPITWTTISDVDVEFGARSRTATIVRSTEDETQNDGNSRVKAVILLGRYATLSRSAEVWVRDDDIPTVTIQSASAEIVPSSIGGIIYVAPDDTTSKTATVSHIGFEEIVEAVDYIPGFYQSRSGDTSRSLAVHINGYGLSWRPGGVRVHSGRFLIDGEVITGEYAISHVGALTIDEGQEQAFLAPYHSLHRDSLGWIINEGESSHFHARRPYLVTPLGGMGYWEVVPFHCEAVPGDCGYQPQYRIGTPGATRFSIHNDAQGVRVEAGQESVTEGQDITFTLHRYGGTWQTYHPATVRVQVTQNGEFIQGAPPQTVTFAGSPDPLNVDARQGELSKTVTISTANDLVDEADGAITLTILPREGEVPENEGPYEPEPDTSGTWFAAVTVEVLDDDEVGFSVSDAEAEEADGSLTFTVTTVETALETSVEWATQDGGGENPATAGRDYTAAGGTLTFAPGETSKTVTIAVADDDVLEEDETFTIVLSNPVNSALTRPIGTGTIRNDDETPQFVQAFHAQPVVEGQDVVFRLKRFSYFTADLLTQDSPRGRLVIDVTVSQDGDFIDGSAPATAVFEAGSWTTTVTVPTVDDHVIEAKGTLTLTLLLPGPGVTTFENPTPKQGVVYDNDNTVTIEDAEAEEGAGALSFIVSLAAPAVGEVTVDVATVDGAATSHGEVSDTDFGKDFEARSETLTFAEGEQTKQLTVTLVDDQWDEHDREEFTVELSKPRNAVLSNVAATGEILDDEEMRSVRLVPTTDTTRWLLDYPVTVDESGDLHYSGGLWWHDEEYGRPAFIRVEAFHFGDTLKTEREATVHWSVTPGTATAGEDYVVVGSAIDTPFASREFEPIPAPATPIHGGSILLPPGYDVGWPVIIPVDDDRVESRFETFTVELTGADNLALDPGRASLRYRIGDNEATIFVIRSDADRVAEGEDAAFTVSLSSYYEHTRPANMATGAPTTVTYTVSGTASSGADYTAPSGTVTIPVGESSATLTIPTLSDEDIEPDETLRVEVVDAESGEAVLYAGRYPSRRVAIVTIVDRTTSVAWVEPAAEAEEGEDLEFTVRLSVAADEPVEVEWHTSQTPDSGKRGAPATRGVDFETSLGTLTIPAGDTSATITVATIEDTLAEGDEHLLVNLSGASSGGEAIELGGTTAVGTIVDDDDPPTGIALSVTPNRVAEDAGQTTLTVTATLKGQSTLPVATPLRLELGGSQATLGEDYTGDTLLLTLPAGSSQVSGAMTITPVDDDIAEGDEMTRINGATDGLEVDPALVTITDDDDTAATGVTLAVAPGFVHEGAGSTDLIVTGLLTGGSPLPADTVVTLMVAGAALPVEADGGGTTTAATAADFTAAQVTLTIPAGAMQGTGTLSLTAVDDNVAEGDETVQVSGEAAGLTVAPARVILADNDREPTGVDLLVKPPEVDEDAGTVNLQVKAALTGGGTRTTDTVLTLSVHDLTAVSGDDYTAPANVTLTIPAGQLGHEATLALTLIDDSLHEGEEALAVRGSNADAGLPVAGVLVAIADNDVAPTAIALSLDKDRVEEDGGLQLLTVTATLEGNVKRVVDTRLMLTTGHRTTSDADYTALPSELTIMAGALEGAATLVLAPADDSIDEDDETLEVTGTAREPGLTVSARQVTIGDDDTAGVTVSTNALAVMEGSAASYTVVLDSQPTAEVTVAVGGHAGTDISLGGTTLSAGNELTFTADNWNRAQTVTVTAGDVVGDTEVTLSHAVSGGDYGSVTAGDVTVSIISEDPAVVSIAAVKSPVTEGADANAEFTLTRDGPTGRALTVGVTIAQEGDFTGATGPAQITFGAGETSAALNVPIDDDEVKEFDGGAITATLDASDASEEYQVSETAGSAVVRVLDDEAQVRISWEMSEVTVGEAAGQATLTVAVETQQGGSPVVIEAGSQWLTASSHVLNGATAASGFDFTPVSEEIEFAEADYALEAGRHVARKQVPVTIVSDNIVEDSEYFWVQLYAGPLLYDILDAEAVGGFAQAKVSIADDDVPDWTLAVSQPEIAEAGGTSTVTVSAGGVVFADDKTITLDFAGTATVGDDYTVADSGGTVLSPPYSLTLLAGDMSVAAIVTAVNDPKDDDAETILVSAGHDDGQIGVQQTFIIVDDDSAGVTISKDALSLIEGGSGSYTVVLDTQPTADVMVAISGHAGRDITLSGETLANDALTFTADNWNQPQAVTVNAGEDDDAADEAEATLSHAISGASEYQNVSAADVAVAVADDDTAGVTISETALTITEGQSDSYTVVLDTQPTADVMVAISGHAGRDITLSGETLANDALTFTADNWNQPQAVTVNAGEDDDAADEAEATLSHAVSGASEYAAIPTNDVPSVTVTVADKDSAGVSISETALTITEGQSDSYTVVLDTQPTADVTVTISGHSGTDITLSGEALSAGNALSFTADNWDQPQTVTVNAGEDDDAADEAEVTLSHAISGASEYAAIPTNDVPSVTVTITDKDTAGVSISETALTITEGQSDSYTVVLDTQPTADVTIDISGYAGTDMSLSGDTLSATNTLTFTPGNWNQAQTVTVNAGEDDDAADEAQVTLSHAVSGASEYAAIPTNDVPSVTVTVIDKDSAGVSIDPNALTVVEAQSDTYTVVLDTRPTADVTVTISGHAGTSITLSGETLSATNTLTFTPGNWATSQTVTVNAGEDDDAADETEVTLSHAVSGASEYAAIPTNDVPNITVSVVDKDTAGVSIDPTELTVLEGQSDTYTVVLDTRPTADVTVTISGHAGTDITLSGETLTNHALTFTPGNWDQPQTVTVNAGEDDDAADEADVTLSHAVSGASEYQNVSAADVTVAVADDDTAGVTISETALTITEGQSGSYTVVLDTEPTADVTVTISGHAGTDITLSGETLSATNTLTFTPGNWDQAQTVTVNAGEDDDAADETAVTLSHAISGASEYAAIPTNDVPSVTVTVTDKDSAGVSISKTELTITEGGSDSYTVVLDTQPTADVTVAISGHTGTEVSLSGDTLSATNTLTFTLDNWDQAQTVTVNAGEDDDAADEAEATLSHAVSGASEYQNVSAADVTVTVADKDTAGVSIDPNALTVVEAQRDTYTVVLDTRPSADVTVTISGHAGTDISLSGETLTNDALTFTLDNWNQAQTVTVNAGEDDDAADEAEVTLSHAVSGASEYQNVSAADVIVAVTDKDTAGVTISETALTITEGQSGSYTVVLDTQPAAEVTIDITGGGDVTTNPAKLEFRPATWSTAQTVTVNAGADDDGAQDSATIEHSVAAGSSQEYAGLTIGGVDVTITDKDSAGVSISETALTITEGQSDTYTVVLDTQPTTDVTVTISGHSGTDVRLSGETLSATNTLTFTPGNWDQAQTVTVTAGEDDDAADESQVTLSHAVSGASEYQNVSAADVTVTITDKDTPGVTISETALTINEGGSDSYAVKLDTRPSADVTVAISGHSGTDVRLSGDTLSPTNTLTFTPGNWATSHTVTVAAGEDDDAADEAEVTLSHAVSGASEYQNVSAADVTVTVTDKDSAGVSIDPTELTVVEGQSDTYTVVLDTQPATDVTIDITGGGDVTTNPTKLEFTPATWSTAQTVMVNAGEDDDGAQDSATIGHSVAAGSSQEYVGLTIGGVDVTITDKDTAGVTIDPTELTVLEGQSDTYTVVLDTQPSAVVTVAISGQAGTDVSLSGDTLSPTNTLTFTLDNWNQAQTVTVNAGEDDDGADEAKVTLSHAVSGAGEYASIPSNDVPSVTVTITDKDSAGVTIDRTELTVVEGQSNTYTVVLDTQPATDVTIEITGGGDVTTNPTQLVFTPTTWSTEQTVTVNAGEDDDAAQDSVTIGHSVAAGSSQEYVGLTIGGVDVTVTDKDSAGVTIDPTELTVVEGQSNTYTVVLTTRPSADVTVAISGHSGTDITLSGETLTNDALTFTFDNWDQPQTVTLTAGDVSADTDVTLSHAVSGGGYGSVTAQDVSVTIVAVVEDRVTIQVGVTVTPVGLSVPEGGSETYEVVLSERPTGDVTLTVTVEDTANNDVSTDEASLVFTAENWNRKQTVTVRAAHDDDAWQDPAVSISHTVSGANYAGATVPGVSVTIAEDDTAGVSISETALTITEGGSGSYTVVLTTRPSADVTVAISGHAGTDVSLSGETLTNDALTFTLDNWNQAQTVTVNAGEDDDAADEADVTLSHAVSGAGEYASIPSNDVPSVTVTVADKDSAGVTISETALTITEGQSDSYTVVLDTQPATDVTIEITGGGDVTTNPTKLVFTPTTWSTAQTVTVNAGADDDGAQDSVTIGHSVASGSSQEYAGLTIGGVDVTITDKDSAGVTIVPMALTITRGPERHLHGGADHPTQRRSDGDHKRPTPVRTSRCPAPR